MEQLEKEMKSVASSREYVVRMQHALYNAQASSSRSKRVTASMATWQTILKKQYRAAGNAELPGNKRARAEIPTRRPCNQDKK